MTNKSKFVDLIEGGYSSKGESITLGAAMLGDETITIKVELGKLGWATPGVIFRLCCNGNEPAHDKPCHGQ